MVFPERSKKIMKQQKSIYILALIIGWTLFVLVGYYYFHKPVSPETIITPLSALLDGILAFGILCLAGGVGSRLLKLSFLTPLERTAIHGAIGLALLGCGWMILGWLHLFTSWGAWLILSLGLIIFRHDVATWLNDLKEIFIAYQQASKFEKILGFSTLILIGFQLITALAPPVKWDVLTYHFQLPRQYLDAGYLLNLPKNPYWGHPQLVEMIYAFAMVLHRPETASVVSWAVGVLFLIGIAGFVERLSHQNGEDGRKNSTGWVVIVAIVVGTTYRNMLGSALSDHFSALFGLSAIIFFLTWLENNQIRWFYLTCLFCGFAITVKLTSGVLLLGIILAVLFDRKLISQKVGNVLVGGVIAALPILPWLTRNLITTGNPVFPFIFPTEYFSTQRLAIANNVSGPIEWLPRLTLPVSLTWMGIDHGGLFMTDFGPLFLLLALPGFLVLRKDHRAHAIAIVLLPAALALAFGSIWLTHLIQPRLYFVVLPILAIYAGAGWNWMQQQNLAGVRLRRFIGAVILLVLGLVLVTETLKMTNELPLRAVLGTGSEVEYRLTNLGNYETAMQSIKSLPADSQVLMLWEPRGFYAPVSSQPDLWLDQFLTDWRELGNPEMVMNKWKAQGFTHLLVYQAGVEFIQSNPSHYTKDDWNGLRSILLQCLMIESINDVYRIYELK